jgi:hypothetical protein
MAQLKLDVANLDAAVSRVDLETKQRIDRLNKQFNDHLEKTAKKEEMFVVCDMLVNFYKAFVFVNKEHFSSCFREPETDNVNLQDFYKRHSDESTHDEIVSRINSSTKSSTVYDGLVEINSNLKSLRIRIDGNCYSIDSIDNDFRFDFERYLTYLKDQVNKLTYLSLNGDFILVKLELVKTKQ